MGHSNREIVYAGFFTRLLATIVDILLIALMLGLASNIMNIKSPFIFLAVWWFYSTLMIVKYKATIGGKLFSIKIVNDKLKPLSFITASYRFFLSVAPFILYVLLRGMQHGMLLAPSPTLQQLPQLLFLLPPFLVFFTPKRQMIHDLLAHSVVLDSAEAKSLNHEEKKGMRYFLLKVLKIGGTLVILVIGGYLLLYVGVFYILAKQSQDSYNDSFEHLYSVNDFNNSKVIFYNHELQNSTEKFIEADGMYEIFEADVKTDLARNCIEYFLTQEHNVSNSVEMGSSFRKNARNRYINSESMVEKAKKNEAHMGKYFYYYDLNDVNGITEEIANRWEKGANIQTCQKMLPINAMYQIFLTEYIKNREKALARDKHQYKYAKPSGIPNKSFYKKEIEETSEWLDMLYKQQPR